MGVKMDINFEKTMAMLNGESTTGIEIATLCELDRIQITNALDLIFQGLSLRNWLAGGVLRDAWQNALDQLREMVFSITNVNPATIFARQATFEMRTTWQNKMTTSGHTNMPIQCPENQRDEWANNAEIKIQNGTELLMQKINNFTSGTPNAPHTTVTDRPTPTFQQVFDSRIREENQRVRERKFPN